MAYCIKDPETERLARTLAQAIDTFKDKPEQVAELITLEAQLAGLQEQ